jgi:UDP-GlcNAc3NAcA epimerase
MRILTVVGARPQFIKAAVVSRAAAARGIDERIVHTGQHYDANMSDVFFDELAIPRPARHLGIGSGSHGAQTGRMLEALEAAIVEDQPAAVLVYGDTNSTLAGALAAAKLHVPVAHVEAGLRSFNRRMPEEINRVLTDHVSAVLFAPTDVAVRNLAAEGIAGDKVVRCGDVMQDAAIFYAARAADRPAPVPGLARGGYVLSTIHRAENTDDPARLRAILEGLATVAETLPVVLPLHPRTRKFAAADPALAAALARLQVIEPVGYLDMVRLETEAAVIATDSGGVQKEAFFHGVPCVTLRDETEWVELVEGGWNRLVPPVTASAIAEAVLAARGSRGHAEALYGQGDAGERIVADLLARFSDH